MKVEIYTYIFSKYEVPIYTFIMGKLYTYCDERKETLL